MTRAIAPLLALALLLGAVIVPPTRAEPPAGEPADPPTPIREIADSLGRGVNLGNMLEGGRDWGSPVREEYLEAAHERSFDAVRIPARWSMHAMDEAPYTIDEAFMARVERAVGWAMERGMRVILNVHHYEQIMEDPDAHEERLLALWRQIGERFADRPETLLFELLNEPNGALTPERWNAMIPRVLSAVRETNPDRAVLVGTAGWGGIDALDTLELPEDPRLIVTVHYYSPFEFTHQGAGWVGERSQGWVGRTWTGTPEQVAAVHADFERVAGWGEERGRPMHLGEFGAYEKAPMESRVAWTRAVREAAEERGISWAYWELAAGFGVYDRETGSFREGLTSALLGAPDPD